MNNDIKKVNNEFSEFLNSNSNKFNEQVYEKICTYLNYYNKEYLNCESIMSKKIGILLCLSKIYRYLFSYHYYYKRINIAKEILDDAISNIQYIVDNCKNEINLDDNVKSILAILEDDLSYLYYRYACINQLHDDDIEKAIDNYKISAELGYIGALNNLAYIYSIENSSYYNFEEAKRLYLEGANQYIDEKILDKNNVLLRKIIQGAMCIRVAQIEEDIKDYELEQNYLNKALKICKEVDDKNAALEIEKKIIIVEDYLKNKIKYTSKHEYVDSLFSEKAKKHLTEDNYIFIETSLLVYDYLNSLNNDSIDYSSAIISVLKCLEQILFEIFGSSYYDYIANLKNINFRLVPNNFKRKVKKEYVDELIDKNSIHMELGSFIYACSYFEDGKYKINKLFNDYMNSRGIKNFDSKIDEFVRRLINIKDTYRNPTAHKNRINKMKAQDCLDYLLNTIKFINECLENFYID